MTVYILRREDQNDHGYVDTSIAGVFRDEDAARQGEARERENARDQGLIVEDDDSPDGAWQVSWSVEAHLVN
jgi:hypothetical protein